MTATIATRVRVGSDGNLVIPVGIAEAGQEVDVVVSPAHMPPSQAEWWALLDRTAGSIDDPEFERPPQTPFPVREGLE